jgi:hypothetical protein
MKRRQAGDTPSLNSLYLAAWAKVLSAFSGSDDITFGLWQAGRSALPAASETLAFPCLNILPMRVIVPSDARLEEIAFQVQTDLKRRTHDVEQSSLLDIDIWICGNRKPLCDVSINILHLSRANDTPEDGLLRQVELPYEPSVRSASYSAKRCDIADIIKVSYYEEVARYTAEIHCHRMMFS